MTTVFDFTAQSLDGREVALRRFEGQVLLIVNTASACGFTPAIQGAEALHRKYAPRGFAVLGFPCNQFGAGAGRRGQIAAFCKDNYAVSFPMVGKIEVNGAARHPLYKFLKNEKAGLLAASIKWNFTKLLSDRSGRWWPGIRRPRDPKFSQESSIAVNETTPSPAPRLPTGCPSIRAARITTRAADPRHRRPLQGVEKNNVEEYCVSEAGSASPPAPPRTATAIR